MGYAGATTVADAAHGEVPQGFGGLRSELERFCASASHEVGQLGQRGERVTFDELINMRERSGHPAR